MAKSYFAILGVTKSSSQEEIKSAYRRLAKEFHPDHHEGDSTAFRQIQEAYSVLGDSRRRNEYVRALDRSATRRHGGSVAQGMPEPLIPEQRGGHAQRLTMVVSLTRLQALIGGNIRIMVPARRLCPMCQGYGSVRLFICPCCKGAGAVFDDAPVSIAFPAGLTTDFAVEVPLRRLGIRNVHLTVLIRPPEEG